jgi:hypothetical protein
MQCRIMAPTPRGERGTAEKQKGKEVPRKSNKFRMEEEQRDKKKRKERRNARRSRAEAAGTAGCDCPVSQESELLVKKPER